MQPTPAALEFVGPIKKALELIDGTLTREGLIQQSLKKDLFCTPDVAASKVAAKVVQTLQEEAPKIKITNIALQNGVLERLKNHDIDFILAADPHMVQMDHLLDKDLMNILIALKFIVILIDVLQGKASIN